MDKSVFTDPLFPWRLCTYNRVEDWHIKRVLHPGRPVPIGEPDSETVGDPVLENPLGGDILLDEPVSKLLNAIGSCGAEGCDFEYLDKQKIVSGNLLERTLKIFVRIGVVHITKAPEGVTEEVNNIADHQEPCKQKLLEVQEHFLEKVSTPPRVAGGRRRPLVSLVIVNYNGDNHLEELLSSIEGQSYREHEVVIVDNSSTDNSVSWIRDNYPDVNLIALKKNIGFAAAVNTGIDASKGEYMLVLNNDILLDRDAVAHLAARALSIGGPWSAVVPKMKFYNNRAFLNAIGNSLYPITWGSDNFIGQIDFGQFDEMENSFSACFGAVLLNREVYKEIGPLDKRYKFYYEDMDWSFRAQAAGYPIYTAPESDIYHKFGASMSLKSQTFKTGFVVKNRLYFILKNLQSRSFRCYLPNYLIEDIKSTLIYGKNRNLPMVWAYMRGYTRLLFSLPSLFFKRRKVKRLRKVGDEQIFSTVVPLNMTVMDRGMPKLDIFSIRTNYAFLDTPLPQKSKKESCDILIYRMRPPKLDKFSPEKIYMEYVFQVPEEGTYDIHLLGLTRGSVDIYLDNRLLEKPAVEAEAPGQLKMNYFAAAKVTITAGRHTLELQRRNHVYGVVLRKVIV
ncbi:MAG: glycosyltransferase family 2 protein [bacterium]|nr:glycosyltransferase family 2 protein [bacterium]